MRGADRERIEQRRREREPIRLQEGGAYRDIGETVWRHATTCRARAGRCSCGADHLNSTQPKQPKDRTR